MLNSKSIFEKRGAGHGRALAPRPSGSKRALYAADAPGAQEDSGGDFPARCGGRIEHRGAARRDSAITTCGRPSPFRGLRVPIRANSAVDLDGFFGLHPALAPLKPIYEAQHLAIVHAAGSPDPTRSHFDAQDYMESGTPGLKATSDGWLNRALPAGPGHALAGSRRGHGPGAASRHARAQQCRRHREPEFVSSAQRWRLESIPGHVRRIRPTLF